MQNSRWSKKIPCSCVWKQDSALRTKTACTHLQLYLWNTFSINILYKLLVQSNVLYYEDSIPVIKCDPSGNSPELSRNDQNITITILVFSMTNSCVDYYTFTRFQFSFGYCCLKLEKACSSGHQFLLWMCPGRKALASTVTLKFVYIHSENSD